MNIKVIISAICASLFSLSTFDAYAQAVPNSQVGTVIKKAQAIELTIDAPEPFYVGGNIFLLRVGNSIFSKYNQTDVDGKGKLTYLIPLSDYAKLIDGDKMFLTYGVLIAPNTTEQDLHRLGNDNPNSVKYLGVFRTKMLKK